MYPVLFHIGPLLVPSYGIAVALGVLAALALSRWTASRCDLGSEASNGPRHAWNLIVLAVFAAIAVERLLLIVMNLGDLRKHPQWLLAIAMVHHPLLAAVGAATALLAIGFYARWACLPLLVVLDTLAAPLCLGLAFEQAGALLEGSGYGREVLNPHAWSVTYSSAFAANWGGAPLGVPVYPVQAYTAIALLVLTLWLCLWLARAYRKGEIAGGALIGLGAILFLTEGYRDWEGRGVLSIADGEPFLDMPQLAAVLLVLLGAALLIDWRASRAKAA
ncbi:MAG TPA: prolipoprotein diacylglyceryl transferase family protein [Acidobacteriaceae bacterium]